MKVTIPTPLRAYTNQAGAVQAQGETLAALVWDLDAQFPGIRFRMIDEQDAIRPHIRFFVNQQRRIDLETPVDESDEIQILQALSGG